MNRPLSSRNDSAMGGIPNGISLDSILSKNLMKSNTTSYELKVQRRLNREKVLEFEREMADRLKQLQQIEAKMEETNVKRVEWLKNISSQHHQDATHFQRRVHLIKSQADLISNQLKMDILRLESQLEAVQLASLVEGTRALDPRETLEKRELAIFLRQKSDLENIKASLQSSLDYRVQLSNYLYQLLEHLSAIAVANSKETEIALAQIEKQLLAFREQMETIYLDRYEQYQSIMKEYLVLRHNANVIQEIIRRNQNQCIYHRSKIQQDLQSLLNISKEKHAKLEISNTKEITALTNDLRQEIMHKEQIVEELAAKVHHLKREKNQNYQSLTNEILSYEKKIVSMEKRRQEDVKSIKFEIQYLRQTIDNLQKHLFLGESE